MSLLICLLLYFYNQTILLLHTGKFHNPAVVEALLRLLDDEDANVRAVAAISIGRTGVQEEAIIDRLIEKLSDGDRIVRQSVCLSLGALKAKKAIPHISNLW